MATIREVAKLAGVSPATVSHVINSTRFVSNDVKDRVQQAMRQLGYRPNALARSLRRGETLTIGLILPDSANPFFAEIGRAIEVAASQHNYSVILCNSEGAPERESFYLNVLYNKRVDGVILVSVGESPSTLSCLQDWNIPLVVVDRNYSECQFDTIRTDNRLGGQIATRHLIQLGHTRIACITGTSGITPSAARVSGYLDALAEADLPVIHDLICRGDFHAESGWQAGRALFSLPHPPTAIFACNDLMAVGVVRAAVEKKLRVPQDVALVGYDDIDLAAYMNPPLTTVAQAKQEMGQVAVDMLIAQMDQSQKTRCCKVLQPVLVIRETCGATQETATKRLPET